MFICYADEQTQTVNNKIQQQQTESSRSKQQNLKKELLVWSVRKKDSDKHNNLKIEVTECARMKIVNSYNIRTAWNKIN